MDPHWSSSIAIMLCVILETILPCSVSSSYAIFKDLHPTPQGSLRESCLCWPDRLLDTNHAHDTKWRSRVDRWTNTHGRKTIFNWPDLFIAISIIYIEVLAAYSCPLGMINIFHFHYNLHYTYVIIFYRSRLLLLFQHIAESYTLFYVKEWKPGNGSKKVYLGGLNVTKYYKIAQPNTNTFTISHMTQLT